MCKKTHDPQSIGTIISSSPHLNIQTLKFRDPKRLVSNHGVIAPTLCKQLARILPLPLPPPPPGGGSASLKSRACIQTSCPSPWDEAADRRAFARSAKHWGLLSRRQHHIHPKGHSRGSRVHLFTALMQATPCQNQAPARGFSGRHHQISKSSLPKW